MKKGDKVIDILTRSVWTIIDINVKRPGQRLRWHVLESEKGARRRVYVDEFEHRYQKAPVR